MGTLFRRTTFVFPPPPLQAPLCCTRLFFCFFCVHGRIMFRYTPSYLYSFSSTPFRSCMLHFHSCASHADFSSMLLCRVAAGAFPNSWTVSPRECSPPCRSHPRTMTTPRTAIARTDMSGILSSYWRRTWPCSRLCFATMTPSLRLSWRRPA